MGDKGSGGFVEGGHDVIVVCLVFSISGCVRIVLWKNQLLETVVHVTRNVSDVWVVLSRGRWVAYRVQLVYCGVVLGVAWGTGSGMWVLWVVVHGYGW